MKLFGIRRKDYGFTMTHEYVEYHVCVKELNEYRKHDSLQIRIDSECETGGGKKHKITYSKTLAIRESFDAKEIHIKLDREWGNFKVWAITTDNKEVKIGQIKIK